MYLFTQWRLRATTTDELVSTSTSPAEQLLMPTATDMALVSTSTDQTAASTTQETASLTQISIDESPTPAATQTTTSTQTISADMQKLDSLTIDSIIQRVADEQSTFYDKKGRYLQILEGGRLPEYESGDLQTDFDTSSLGHISVNVYDGPSGKGFQVVYRDKYVVRATGYGPDAAIFTYTNSLVPDNISSASSTVTTTTAVVPDSPSATSSETTTDQSADAPSLSTTSIDSARTTAHDSEGRLESR
jgi:hypothetical protein